MIRTEKHLFIKECLDSDTDECIEWPFPLKKGHAYLKYDSREFMAKRLLCMILFGDRLRYKKKSIAINTCETKNCCNPKHVRWKRCKTFY